MQNLQLTNKKNYEIPEIVEYFAKEGFLQEPEKTILNMLGEELKNMKMLDMGVGGGRTTYYFAPLVKEYVGIDYSSGMIDACNNKYYNNNNNISFIQCDVRNMDIFENDTFDFILFSFNGIDSISFDDRIKVLEEINRIGKKDAYYCFSTLNILYLEEVFKFRLSRNILKAIIKYVWTKVINDNPKTLIKKDYAIIYEWVYDLKFSHCYINPIFQAKELSNIGFKDIRIFSLKDGREIDNIDIPNVKDPWLYFLCRVEK
jgi:ubiquinone/menaquinone biosynthesis C-methylase UbiE